MCLAKILELERLERLVASLIVVMGKAERGTLVKVPAGWRFGSARIRSLLMLMEHESYWFTRWQFCTHLLLFHE